MASIDIAVPCYNYGRFLADCVGTIVNQSFRNLRVLIIDNGSTDDSLEIAGRLAHDDPRIHILSFPQNIGPHGAYNAGVDWAAADYFFLIDADDVLAPGALERAIDFMEGHPSVAMCYGRELRLEFAAGTVLEPPDEMTGSEWSAVSGREFLERQVAQACCTVGASTVIRRTSAQKAAGHYRRDLPFANDWELWMRMAAFGDIASTDAVQAIRRLHGRAQSTIYDNNPLRDFVEREATFACFFSHEGKSLADADRLLAQARRNLAAQAYWSGVSHAVRGYPRQGWELLGYAFSRRPSTLLLPPVGQLLKMHNPLERLKDVVVEAVTGKPQGHWLRDREQQLSTLNAQTASSPTDRRAL
jgi:glycosyltransferase involved in cell wall biosynthesis